MRISIKMTHPIKLEDAVQIQLGYHLLREAGWQSGHAAVCNTVYAGSIPTPASNFLSTAAIRHHPKKDPPTISDLSVYASSNISGCSANMTS